MERDQRAEPTAIHKGRLRKIYVDNPQAVRHRRPYLVPEIFGIGGVEFSQTPDTKRVPLDGQSHIHISFSSRMVQDNPSNSTWSAVAGPSVDWSGNF